MTTITPTLDALVAAVEAAEAQALADHESGLPRWTPATFRPVSR